MNFPENIDEHNEEQLSQIVSVFSESLPQKAIIIFNDYSFRDQSLERIVEELPTFSHIALDLGEVQVNEVSSVMEEKLSDIISDPHPENYLVHIINLETSLFHEIYSGEAAFIQNLADHPNQLEEVFAANYLIWTDPFAHGRLENQAKEFTQTCKAVFSLLQPEGNHESNPYEQLEKLTEQLKASEKTETEQAETLLEIGGIFQMYRKPGQALEIYEQALEKGKDTDIESAAQTSMGITYAEQGNLQEAKTYLETGIENLSRGETAQYRRLLAHAHSSLGEIFTQSGAHDLAIQHFEKASEINAAEGLFVESAIAQNHLAVIHERKGNIEKAVSAYEQTADYFSQAGKDKLTARAYQQVGMVRQGRFQWGLAMDAFKKALVEAQKTDDEFLILSLEDSIEQLEEKNAKPEPKKKEEKKKGFFGKLFG